MTPHTETQTGYGVLITRKDGTKNFWRQGLQALEEAKFYAMTASLIYGKDAVKVVRIKATWEVVG